MPSDAKQVFSEFPAYLKSLNEDHAALAFDDDLRVLTISWRAPYHIAYERIDSPDKLLRWIVHLSEKNWVTKQRLAVLADACGQRFGYRVRGA
jgi:hypothetical protein